MEWAEMTDKEKCNTKVATSGNNLLIELILKVSIREKNTINLQ
jgi:hypothetical protein